MQDILNIGVHSAEWNQTEYDHPQTNYRPSGGRWDDGYDAQCEYFSRICMFCGLIH